MAGARLVVTAALAAGGALSGALGSERGPAVPPTPFGGSVAVDIARVGHIEVDLEPAGPGRLARVPCVDALAGTDCFVAIRR